MLKITVKHTCGHYEIHAIDARNDGEAAEAEVKLQKLPCTTCIKKLDDFMKRKESEEE